jgi:hypothetical protein
MRHAATYRGARRNYARYHGFLNQWRTFDMLLLDQRKSKQVVHQSFIEARNQTGWRAPQHLENEPVGEPT